MKEVPPWREAAGGPLHHAEEQCEDNADHADHADSEGEQKLGESVSLHCWSTGDPGERKAEGQTGQRAAQLGEARTQSSPCTEQPPGSAARRKCVRHLVAAAHLALALSGNTGITTSWARQHCDQLARIAASFGMHGSSPVFHVSFCGSWFSPLSLGMIRDVKPTRYLAAPLPA
ncbi:hypothetical protein NicSoilB4_15640 [Arthrobacter sp. NicSoilB4]|nr:hypothetical protein NicSoilB4_15640 [Arthrobacter sp. NicSoilB4]